MIKKSCSATKSVGRSLFVPGSLVLHRLKFLLQIEELSCQWQEAGEGALVVAKDVKMVEALIDSIPDRIKRDEWVKQAKALAKKVKA